MVKWCFIKFEKLGVVTPISVCICTRTQTENVRWLELDSKSEYLRWLDLTRVELKVCVTWIELKFAATQSGLISTLFIITNLLLYWYAKHNTMQQDVFEARTDVINCEWKKFDHLYIYRWQTSRNRWNMRSWSLQPSRKCYFLYGAKIVWDRTL